MIRFDRGGGHTRLGAPILVFRHETRGCRYEFARNFDDRLWNLRTPRHLQRHVLHRLVLIIVKNLPHERFIPPLQESRLSFSMVTGKQSAERVKRTEGSIAH